jgi:hypothetical protein
MRFTVAFPWFSRQIRLPEGTVALPPESCRPYMGIFRMTSMYPLVNIQKTMENHHLLNGKITTFNGKIHFYGHFQSFFGCLPEGISH